MSNGTISLGRLFGIRFEVHIGWFVIFGIVTIFLSTDVFPFSLEGRDNSTYWIMGIASSLLFFASVLFHELAHSLVGLSKGIPVKNITLFIFGGAANITKEADKADDDLLMAVSGPISSVLLAGIFWFLYTVALNTSSEIALVCLWLAQINLILAIFNMLPGFPLDGGRIFRSIIWKISGNYKRSTEIASHVGRGFGILLIFGGVAFAVIQQSLFSGIWMSFIGWFLYTAASNSYKQVNLQHILRGYNLGQVSKTGCTSISSEMSLLEFANRYGLELNASCYTLKYPNGDFGYLNMRAVKSEELINSGNKKLAGFSEKISAGELVSPDTDLLLAVQIMNEYNLQKLPILESGEIKSVVYLNDIIRFVQKEQPEHF